MPRVRQLLEELTNAHGPSGFEGPVRAIVRRELAPFSALVETDGMGSLVARLRGGPETPVVMMAAHMDEVGMLVKLVTPEGFVRFQTVGGWLDQALINQRYTILTHKGPVTGLTGIKTPHVMQQEERSHLVKAQQMFLDVGAQSRADATERLGVRPGDPIVPESRFAVLNDGDLYLAKAWDDRVGLAVMVEVARRLAAEPAPCAAYAVATVQEEVGLRGARTSSYRVRPDVGVNLEAGVASDYPGITQEEAQERLGQGPGIFLHDSMMLPNARLRDLVMDVAAQAGIPVQPEVLSGYGQDGAEMQRAHSGAPTIAITVPTRYLHSHNGIVHRRDFDLAVDLVTALVRRMDARTVEHLRGFD